MPHKVVIPIGRKPTATPSPAICTLDENQAIHLRRFAEMNMNPTPLSRYLQAIEGTPEKQLLLNTADRTQAVSLLRKIKAAKADGGNVDLSQEEAVPRYTY